MHALLFQLFHVMRDVLEGHVRVRHVDAFMRLYLAGNRGESLRDKGVLFALEQHAGPEVLEEQE